MSLLPFVVLWVALAAAVGALAVYRNKLAGSSDELIHIEDTSADLSARQEIVAKKLEVIDKWGKILTVVAAVFGLVLVAAWVYQVWQSSSVPTLQ
jgi:hypothetical protein